MFRVIVAGLRGDQLRHLRRALPNGVHVRAIELSQLLRIRAMTADLVLCTRFISHKHTLHLQRIIQTRVIYSLGGLSSWANAIREEYATRGYTATPRLAV